ncbi:MAG: GTPase HflX [Candidatus Limivicinus sp.]
MKYNTKKSVKGMINIENTEAKRDRAVLVGLAAASMDEHERSSEVSMDELEALVETAGGECVAVLMQNRPTPEPRSFIGEGKVQELKELIEINDCTLAVFDNELSPSQMQVLSKELKVNVLDRSGLILDIFAQRARSKEGQLQVELAQYNYLLPRLTGMWSHLVRQTAAGGSSPIGTRGPGETQLETDRRHIRRKIQKLEEELAAVRKVRGTQRRRREKNDMPMVALVGYTNAGKSTLLNCLTGDSIPANNRLFDTLDTTTRRLRLDETQEVLISDTVGFIRKLPTHLIEAFKATLEELSFADVLLHVIDISNPEWEEQARVVDGLVRQLGAEATPCIRVYNKCDAYFGILPHGEDTVCMSAKSGEGADVLLKKLAEMLGKNKKHVRLLVPYSDGGTADMLRREAAVLSMEYGDGGIEIEAVVSPEIYGRVKKYIPGREEPRDD